MNFRILLFMLISVFCRAQSPGKTVIFKVRAQPTECEIICKDSFLLEKNNVVQIKVTGHNKNIKVEVAGGKIVSIKNDLYSIRCLHAGLVAISVYLNTPTGRKLIRLLEKTVKNPTIFFCGLQVDASSKYLKTKGTNFYAWSEYYKKEMPVVSFEMYYVDDTLVKKLQPVMLKSDTCMLSPEMKKKILAFQPGYNYMYFNNIIFRTPDGSKRFLDPIEFHIAEDTLQNKLLLFSIKMKRL